MALNQPLEKLLKPSAKTRFYSILKIRGALAQLIERIIRIDEVKGLNPLCSTIFKDSSTRHPGLFNFYHLCYTQLRRG